MTYLLWVLCEFSAIFDYDLFFTANNMRAFILIISIILTTTLFAQPYTITGLGIEQGLSNDHIVGIAQDKDGFLWFATEEGLNKFDGSRFINYFKHTQSLSGNELNCIYADPNQPVIWIATQRAGLNAYNYQTDKLQVFSHNPENPESLITNDVTDITPAIDGNLWISTYHRGIEHFDKRTQLFTHYNTQTIPDLPSDNIWTIMDDHNGNLYIGHVEYGLSILSIKDKRVKNYTHNPDDPESIPGNVVRCIYKDSNGNIWIGTEKGLALFNTETEKFIKLGDSAQNVLSSYIYTIRQLDDNKLWVATELNGIYIIDLKQHFFMSPGKLSYYHLTVGYNKYSLSNPTVRSIFQDSFKNIWIGTYGGGINFIGHSNPLFNSISYSPIAADLSSINNRVVQSVCTDANDNLWIGTDGGGINVFSKGKRIAIYNQENGNLTHNSVIALHKDSQNNIWIGTFAGGVNFYDQQRKTFRQIKLNGTSDSDVRCFYEDKKQNIWIGTNNGIFVFDTQQQKQLSHYTHLTHRLPENFVRSICQDPKGQMWIGTFGQGLAIYSPEMNLLAEFNETNGFSSNMINQIFRDSRGRMWIATGEGLLCFPTANSLEYNVFQRNEGLHNAFIRSISEDAFGNIWFSTNAGISCYLTETDEFRNYNYFDKTPMGSFTTYAVTQDKEGSVYFGSINGVRYFDPASVLTDRTVPPAIITEMKVYDGGANQKNNRNIHYFGDTNINVALNHKQNTFNILFNVQDYSIVNQIDYAYRLKGLNDSWQTIEENNVIFRNIPPGNYEFQVRTRIKNQNWSDAVSTLFITINPPLWLTWWAKVIYVLVIMVITFSLLYFYKKRVDIQSSYELEKKNREQEQELNNERLRFYTNIAHELRTPLTLILGPLEDLQKDTTILPKQLQKITMIRQSATRLLNLINQILEFRKTETQNKKLCVQKENLATLVKEINLKYKELNRNPELNFSLSIQNEDLCLYFDKEVITIILDNLISNAIKYTEKGQIKLSLYNTVKNNVEYTEIQVSDTGRGIPTEELNKIFDRYYQAKNDRHVSGTGIGLSLVKNLVKLHEGEINVESELDAGTSFYISLLTHNTYPNALHGDGEKPKETEESVDFTINDAPHDSHKPILLIVEDNEDIQQYISDSFAESYEIVTASEGNEGYQAAITHIPDIIVSDIMMPGMNGIAFCKKVKEDVRTSHIPIILLTAKDSMQDKEEGYTAGADSYLTKPFSATLLHSRINNLLETRKKLADQYSANINVTNKSTILKDSLNKLDNEFLNNITTLIEENLESEKIDVAYLSDKMFMSSSTLYRKIKALTGISTNEYVRKVKMKNAEQLLLEGKYNVSEIAFRVGMNSPVYFRQCFKEEFGLTPSEYLKKLKAGD